MVMSNNISSFDGGDCVNDLSEILNQLKQSEKDEIEFLCKDFLKSELIPAFWKDQKPRPTVEVGIGSALSSSPLEIPPRF